MNGCAGLAFRDEKQRGQACRVLLSLLDLEDLFFNHDCVSCGPREKAWEKLRELNNEESSLAFGEGVLLRVAFDLWGGNSGSATLYQMVTHLDSDILFAVGDLMVRASPHSDSSLVDDWISSWVTGGPDTFQILC